MKRHKKLFFIFIPLVLGFISFIVSYKPDFIVWPSNIRKGFYSDSITKDKGNSGIRPIISSSDTLRFEYILGTKYEFPYVGATFEFESDSAQRISDLSGYDYVRIELEAALSKRIPIVINQDIKSYSRLDIGSSYRPLIKELVYEQGKTTYELALADFQTPSWWLTINDMTEKEIGKPDFARSHSVQIHNCQVLPKNVKETFTIYKLSFYKDMRSFWLGFIAFVILYYTGLVLILKYGNPIKLIFPRKELMLGNMADEESKKILNYISEHYNNPELSMELLQKELGMSETRISFVIKDISDMNFKRYLNTLRLEEAKRLLINTDRPVMDIAYKVGYGNVTHFNRVFKESESCSPNEYRKAAIKPAAK